VLCISSEVYLLFLSLGVQDLDISGDPADGRALYIVAYHKKSSQKPPALSGRFLFEDHIRCSVTKSFLQRSQESVFMSKMKCLSKLLHMPSPESLMSIPGLPGSHRGLHQHQTPPNLSDVSSLSLLGFTTPVLAAPSPPTSRPRTNAMNDPDGQVHHMMPSETPRQKISSSVVHRVFTSPSKELKNSPDNIELSSLVPSDSYLTRENLSPGHLSPAIPLGVSDVLLGQAPVHLTTPIPEDKHRTRIGDETGSWRMKGISKERLDMSPTPEPNFPDEEGRTASGGMLEHQRMSSSERSRETSVELSVELEQEKEAVCPLGLEIVLENETMEDGGGDLEELNLKEGLCEGTSLEVGAGDGESCDGSPNPVIAVIETNAETSNGGPATSVSDPVSSEPPEQAVRTVAVEVAAVVASADSEVVAVKEEEKGQMSQVLTVSGSREDNERKDPLTTSDSLLNLTDESAKPTELNGDLSLPVSSAETGMDSAKLPNPLSSHPFMPESIRDEMCRVEVTAAPPHASEGVSEAVLSSDQLLQVHNGTVADDGERSQAEANTSADVPLLQDSVKDSIEVSVADQNVVPTENKAVQNHKPEDCCNSKLSDSYDRRKEQSVGEGGSYLDSEEFSHSRNYEDEMEMFL